MRDLHSARTGGGRGGGGGSMNRSGGGGGLKIMFYFHEMNMTDKFAAGR